jgi:FkbM family methyltransferase
LKTHKDWLVLDIGANIGQYSLIAAKMGSNVLAVEPFYDSILRIHKGAIHSGVQHKILLIKNVISNIRNDVKMLRNIRRYGEQHVDINDKTRYKRNKRNKYLVETILFDDLLNYLPKYNKNQAYKKAIIKMDLEGLEPLALAHASKIFEHLDIPVIIMRWETIKRERISHALVDNMITFLINHGLKPHPIESTNVLNLKNWKSWPRNVIWKKDGY